MTLSVTEAEQAGCVTCAQDMIFQKQILESIGLQVELPMILECDNKGAVDLANNWTAGGRTRHVDVRQNWLQLDCPSDTHWACAGIFAFDVRFQIRDQFWISL